MHPTPSMRPAVFRETLGDDGRSRAKTAAIDVQRGRREAESCYRRALELAPRSRLFWHDYAHHLQAFPERRQDALKALDACLALDPFYPAANTLRQQLIGNH